MPILALTDAGLIIDVFGGNPISIQSEAYQTSSNLLVTAYKSKIRFLDLLQPQSYTEDNIPGFVEMRMSKNGKKVAVLCYNKVLYIFDEGTKIVEHANVENYSISDNLYSFSTEDSIEIYTFSNAKRVFSSKIKICEIHCQNAYVMLIAEKALSSTGAESKKVYIFHNNGLHLLLDVPNVYRTVLKTSTDDMSSLLLLNTGYSKDSYYADSSLYLLTFSDSASNAIESLSSKSESPNEQKVSKGEPELIEKNSAFQVLWYSSLKKVHDFGFLNSLFYVVFGDQPAYLHVYSLSGGYQRKYPKAIRNKVVFNRKENRIINCGLGNLPGNIEVSSNNSTTSSFEMLGVSLISWLNNDAYFMAAITSYFKSDNKIVIFDYFGRIVQVKEFKSLISANVYGVEEDEPAVDQPEKIINKKPQQAAYVPPHLRESVKPQTSKKKLAPKPSEAKPKISERNANVIQQELEECLRIKEKMRNNEIVSLEEENKIFKIKELEKELSKVKKQ